MAEIRHNKVSMLFRASHHFHEELRNENEEMTIVSMLFRASHHFHVLYCLQLPI